MHLTEISREKNYWYGMWPSPLHVYYVYSRVFYCVSEVLHLYGRIRQICTLNQSIQDNFLTVYGVEAVQRKCITHLYLPTTLRQVHANDLTRYL